MLESELVENSAYSGEALQAVMSRKWPLGVAVDGAPRRQREAYFEIQMIAPGVRGLSGLR